MMYYIRQAPMLVAVLLAAEASAAPSVEMYGNLDLGIVKQSGSAAGVERGYNNWIGFRGQEDLGGGLTALFNLQTRFNPDTGQQERPLTFWQGESTVGVKSASAGTLRLGRALSPLWKNVWAFEPWQNSGFNGSLAAYQTGSYSSDGVNDIPLGYANFSRISNGVFYTSPEMNGFSADIAAEIEKAEGADGRVMGVSLNYFNGPAGAMLSYERNAREDEIVFLGGSYRIGAATVLGSYSQNWQQVTGRERTFVVAGTYAIGANTLRVGYGGNLENDNDKISAGIVHALSARTSLYADVYRETTADSFDGVAFGISHTF